jgi:hypothetical protein
MRPMTKKGATSDPNIATPHNCICLMLLLEFSQGHLTLPVAIKHRGGAPENKAGGLVKVFGLRLALFRVGLVKEIIQKCL